MSRPPRAGAPGRRRVDPQPPAPQGLGPEPTLDLPAHPLHKRLEVRVFGRRSRGILNGTLWASRIWLAEIMPCSSISRRTVSRLCVACSEPVVSPVEK